MKTHDVLCDSGVLISLTAGCMDNLLHFFAQNYHLRFIIPPSVEYESVLRPLQSDLRKYLFSAIRIRNAMDDGVIVRVDANVANRARRIMELANNLFYVRGNPMRLLQQGECEILALARTVGVEYILIDERTTRVLVEAPLSLKDHLEKEFGVHVMVNKKNLKELTSEIAPLRAIRSSELVMLAYEKGFFRSFKKLEKDALAAALYKMKYCGCSISFHEIDHYLSWVAQTGGRS